MRIDPKTLSTPLSGSAPPRRDVAGRSFSLEGRADAAKTGSAAPAVPLATVDALLALQGEGDPADRRRRSVQRGHDLLDALDRLKAALLSGRVPTADLRTIAARLAERRDLSGDPRLDDILSHIELRARVEMAKVGAA
jgi:Class II flagellar assembly regulator